MSPCLGHVKFKLNKWKQEEIGNKCTYLLLFTVVVLIVTVLQLILQCSCLPSIPWQWLRRKSKKIRPASPTQCRQEVGLWKETQNFSADILALYLVMTWRTRGKQEWEMEEGPFLLHFFLHLLASVTWHTELFPFISWKGLPCVTAVLTKISKCSEFSEANCFRFFSLFCRRKNQNHLKGGQ